MLGTNAIDPKTQVAANIQELVTSLNIQLRQAHELGLKVSAFIPSNLTTSVAPSTVISVRIWEEYELLKA